MYRSFGLQVELEITEGKVICVYIYIHLEPNDPCFDWKRSCFGGLTFKNRGQLGSMH